MNVCSPCRALLAASALLLLSPAAWTQFDNRWVRFQNESATRLSVPPNAISNNDHEVDFAWGDLDQDGFVDLIVVRKQPFTTFGKRTNVLLMNENGVLTDRTTLYATAADVPGDQGFLTPTNDRDVTTADVDQDGWLDFVTAPALWQSGDPKHISHPRVYRNLGNDANGSWQGMRFEDARFPQLVVYSSGNLVGSNACGIAAGDVDGDGDPDLYLVDYDSGPGSGANDLNDRLLINDGFGFFTDGSQAAMTPAMLDSAFGTAGYIVDLNGDGWNDVVKSENGPVDVRYNDPNNPGVFNILDGIYSGSAYHVAVGDLNFDGRLDFVVGDDGADRYRYNTGNDALGRVVWGPNKVFNFFSGGDDGFGNNNIIVDLDGDAFNDVIITDVDVDIGGCSRFTHIYHNPGGTPGSQITLQFEQESPGTSTGWLGAPDFKHGDLTGGHDVAVFDIDNDGGRDIVLGRCSGTFVWMNRQFCPTPTLYGAGAVGSTGEVGVTGFKGSPWLSRGPGFWITGEGFKPNSFGVLLIGTQKKNVQKPWGTLLVGGFTTRVVFQTDAAGRVELPITPLPGWTGATRYFQIIVRDPGFGGNLQPGNAVEAHFCP